MTEFFVTVGGVRSQRLDLYAGSTGPWYLEAILDSDTAVSGRVVARIGALQLSGTVAPGNAGTYAQRRSLRLVAGAGGWGSPLPRENYHDPHGVSCQVVASDAARDCGETLGSMAFPEAKLDAHFVRRVGPGSAVLERLLGDRQWWVDEAGVTQGGTRPTRTPRRGCYQLTGNGYNPLTRTVELAVDDPSDLWVGSVLTEGLDEPQTIREFEIHVDGDKCRVVAYTGGEASSSSRLGRAFAALLEQREAKRLYGTYRYRVYSDPKDGALDLQAVRPIAGLPDVLPVLQSAGIAGALSRLLPGAIVRIAFDEGDPTMPYVSGYASGSPDETAGIARMADMVACGGPLTTATFSVGPAAGLYTAPVNAVGAPGSPTAVPVVVAGVPYLVSFGVTTDVLSLAPPTLVPPMANELIGQILTASTQEIGP